MSVSWHRWYLISASQFKCFQLRRVDLLPFVVLGVCWEGVRKGTAGHAVLSNISSFSYGNLWNHKRRESKYFWLELVNKAACWTTNNLRDLPKIFLEINPRWLSSVQVLFQSFVCKHWCIIATITLELLTGNRLFGDWREYFGKGQKFLYYSCCAHSDQQELPKWTLPNDFA